MLKNHMWRVMVVCFSLVLLAMPLRAQSAARVSITPAEAQVRNGETVQLTVQVTDVQGLYGVDITVRYDATTLEVIDANPGGTVEVTQGTFLDSGTTVLNSADNTAGVIRFAMTQLNPSEAKSGSGSLIAFAVRAKRAGATAALTVEKADLANRDGILISTALVGGRVIVAPAAQPAPGVTVIPTQTPNPNTPATAVPPTSPPATATALPTGVTAAPTAINAPAAQATQSNATAAASTAQSGSTQAPDALLTEATAVVNAAVAQPTNISLPAEQPATPITASAAPATQPGTPAATGVAPTPALTQPALVAAAPVALPTANANTKPQIGLLSPKLELALVSGVCGVGFIIITAIIAVVFILLLQRASPPRVETVERATLRKD
jgi:hypothetical protein